MQESIKCLCPIGDQCGEAALWSDTEQAVYWVDINRFLIHRYHPDSGASYHWQFDEPVVALALTAEEGRILVSLAGALIFWHPENDKREKSGITLPNYPAVRFNDGRADPRGDYWVGSMKNNVAKNGELIDGGKGMGELWQICANASGSEKIKVWQKNLGCSNTVCWSPDSKHFYFGDTMENTIWVYDYDAKTGAISHQRVFFQGFNRGLPDGSCVDAEGYLWNCRFGGGCIVRVSPKGEIDRIIEMPISNPTTCTFGGRHLKTLFITSARLLAKPGERLAGSLFALETSSLGQAENMYLG